MRKILSLLFALFVIITISRLCIADTKPEEYMFKDFKYIMHEDGTAEITGYEGNETELIIPAELNRMTVTSIGTYAFGNNNNLTSITIPDSISSIGDKAFSECKNLTSITIPDSIINIGDNPFQYCSDLSKIIISSEHPVLMMIDGVLFSKPDKRLVCFPTTLLYTEYTIPEGILIIGKSAFTSSKNLISITIPDSVTSIEDSAFSWCENLKSIEIPTSVTSIGYLAFFGCDNLTSITIPNSVTSILGGTFQSCNNLSSITIPDSITTIGNYAFSGCESLKKITIPNSVTTIGKNPFAYCSELSNINISPDQPTLAIIDGVLYSKPDKRLVFYPTMRGKDFDDDADNAMLFVGLLNGSISPESITSFKVPSGIRIIDDYAFTLANELTSIEIPASVEYIEYFAFSDSEISTKAAFTVERDSYAAQYCKDHGFNYTYPDADDWLLN